MEGSGDAAAADVAAAATAAGAAATVGFGSGTCFATGQAAGIAASLVVRGEEATGTAGLLRERHGIRE